MNFLADIFGNTEEWLGRWSIGPRGDVVHGTAVLPAQDDHGHHNKSVREMSGKELAKIAGTCNAKDLAYIVKHGNENALSSCITNPAMEKGHMLIIIEKRSPTAALLTMVSKLNRWVSDKSIAAAICKNPKTPLWISRGIVKSLGKHDLAEISRSGSLPQPLKVAARRALAKKGGG